MNIIDYVTEGCLLGEELSTHYIRDDNSHQLSFDPCLLLYLD